VAKRRGFDPASIKKISLIDFGRVGATTGILTRHGWRTWKRRRDGEKGIDALSVELREAFEELGPTYVKLAQLVASSPGLFPETLSDEFRACLDEVPPVPSKDVLELIEEELGAPAEDIFLDFDREPLAAASIAQVHTATLPTGEKVVVKVQRPKIRERLEKDLRILMKISQILERTWKTSRMANPVAIVEDFSETLRHELNFITESNYMERFSTNLDTFGENSMIRVPRVHWKYTTPRVLTMERIYGYKFDDILELQSKGWDLAGTLKEGVRAWMEAALVHGFFHGDVHAGNLMLDEEGKIVFLDFGICGTLDDETRGVVSTGLPALMVNKDYKTVARSIYEMGAILNPSDLEQASEDIGRIVEPLLEKTLAEISYGEILIEIIKIGVSYEVRLPRELVLIAKQMLYFERYAKLMAPDWAILADPSLIGFLFESSTGVDANEQTKKDSIA